MGQHVEGRVGKAALRSPDGSPRTGGTISLRVFHDNRHRVVTILIWCKERFGDRLKRDSFRDLFTETDCETMMMMLAGRFSSSQINKHRHWFCQLVKFAERRPFRVRLSFGPDEVRQFGETESRCEREIPAAGMIRRLLNAA
ncbi:MAG: hypothetical protein O7G83_10160 [Proteobacteria bacterium]|nr:hypothetical protein [Pseudomonadota bacterium]